MSGSARKAANANCACRKLQQAPFCRVTTTTTRIVTGCNLEVAVIGAIFHHKTAQVVAELGRPGPQDGALWRGSRQHGKVAARSHHLRMKVRYVS